MSLPFSRSESGISEINSLAEWESLLDQDLVVVFKHSPTCPVSWMAHRELLQFRAAHPTVPVFLVSVRRRREISDTVARFSGIRHESPQALIFRRGSLTGSASHDAVTVEFLENETASAEKDLSSK